ncbi:lysophospholipid acyltransferase family protein [Consotaella salsifontis]|uniref:Lyso-ornithine lipid acyltransferase n=1 Tax=Consotaella salsifontis TaxID=1365950 RepID=A0A1T4S5Y0_9HYPH|nr:lysophospholipid acyltransferase family protein [Consotaella salsifontis]SKA23567.1 lyso-ornithine lipid acyltransferase [Consotaella salsifontis]
MIAWGRIAFTVVALALLTAVLLPLQLLATRFGWRIARRLPLLWHRIACPLMGLRVHIRGVPASSRPLLLVANHSSWADIPALGRIMELSFIAKSEVRDWPVFGWLARLQRSVFIDRGERRSVGLQVDAVADRLNAGEVMVLFAEGTTSDGNEVLPFKTSLFGAAQAALRLAEADEVSIQPVAIAYTKANGMPLGRYYRPLLAWPGDVPLGPHLLAALKEGALDAEIVFGEPMRITAESDRKKVARTVETEVSRLLTEALRGRPTSAIGATNNHARARPLASGATPADIVG